MGVRLPRLECRHFFGGNCYSRALLALGGASRVAVLLPKSLWSYHRWLMAVMGIGLFCVLALSASVWFLALPWFPPIGDCGAGLCLMCTVSLAELILQRGSCLSGLGPI
jgi:hypothetical protein